MASSPSGQKVLVATDADSHVFELAPAGAEGPLRKTDGGQLQGGVRRGPQCRASWSPPSAATTDLPYWQTRLAVPLVAEPIVSSTDGDGRITLATVSGDIFQLDRRTLASTTVADEPATWSSGSHGPATDVTDIGGMVTLTAAPAPTGWRHGPDRPTASVAHVALAGAAELSARRVWRRTARASQAGQVFFLDPLSARMGASRLSPDCSRAGCPRGPSPSRWVTTKS